MRRSYVSLQLELHGRQLIKNIVLIINLEVFLIHNFKWRFYICREVDNTPQIALRWGTVDNSDLN